MTLIGIHISKTWLRTLDFVRRNIQTKHQGIRQTAYKTLVWPFLEYASRLWSPYTQANIKKVEAVQHRAARWVTNDYSLYSSVTQMIISLGWRSLDQRRADARLIMFYKIVYGLVAIHLPTHVQRQVMMTRTMHPVYFLRGCLQSLLNIPVPWYLFDIALEDISWPAFVSRCIIDAYFSFYGLVLNIDMNCGRPGCRLYRSFCQMDLTYAMDCLLNSITGMNVAFLLTVSPPYTHLWLSQTD